MVEVLLTTLFKCQIICTRALLLYSMIAYGLTDTLQTCERINVIDPYWSPVQVNPSGSARLISMIGACIIFNSENGLSFFRGVPRKWIECNKSILLKGWKTVFGVASCEVEVDKSGDRMKGIVNIVGLIDDIRGDIVLRHPAFKPIARVLLDGRQYGAFTADRILFKKLPCQVSFEVEF